MVQDILVRQRIVSSILANIVRQPVIRILTVIGSIVVARVLGPEALAVVAVIAATRKTILTFLDLGITKSVGKIIPDIAVKLGQVQAVRILKQLLRLKLLFVSLGFIGLVILHSCGLWQAREDIAYSRWFLPIVGAGIFLYALVEMRQQEWIAAFRMKSLAKLQIIVAFITPLVIIAAAFISKNPYIVAAAQLLPLLFQLTVFFVLPGYDLDAKGSTSTGLSFGGIFSHYWRYLTVTYLIFLFNGFVFGLPLTMFLLSGLGIQLKALGNVAVAVVIVSVGREVANVPLANLRVPIMARMFAENDQRRFLQVQRVMVSILVLTSGVLAVAMLTLAPPVLALVYGAKYQAAITWGVPIAIVALFVNFFSLGNSTIRQVEKYLPVVIGLFLSLIFIVAVNVVGVQMLSESFWPPLVLFAYTIGHAVFSLITDLWTDAAVFQWRGTSIKVRGLFALVSALLVAHWMLQLGPYQSIVFALQAFILGIITFILSFRFMGGVGIEVRKSMSAVLFPRLRWVVNIL